jgi:AraC-like DNA-binding protein
VRTIQTAKPRPELIEFVQAYAQREMDCAGAGFTQPNGSRLEQGIAFDFGGHSTLDYPDGRSRVEPKAYVFGGLTPPCGGTSFAGHVLAFAVFLKPLASWQLFRIPSNILVNRDYDAEDLLGREILDLWSKLAECSTFPQRIRAMEEYLLPFALRARGRTLILRTAQHMLNCKGAIRIDEIAHQAALSMRQYERRFVEEIGMTPKLFARTTRFQRALDTKRLFPDRPWLSIAHEFGYFDQMHMVHDFQSLGGDAPNNVLEQSGDLQPWSLAPHQVLELR